MMSPSSQWGGSSYSGEGPYGGFQCSLPSRLYTNYPQVKLHKQGEYLQTLLKARKIRIISGRVCIVETILHLKASPLRVCIYVLHSSLLSTPRYQICTSATLPTYNFEKSKINFNQCNFVNINIYILKQCSKKSSYDDLKTTMKVNTK